MLSKKTGKKTEKIGQNTITWKEGEKKDRRTEGVWMFGGGWNGWGEHEIGGIRRKQGISEKSEGEDPASASQKAGG